MSSKFGTQPNHATQRYRSIGWGCKDTGLDWYIPMSTDIRQNLTDIEVHNIDMMYNYEDYYEEYYNSFGR